MARPPRRLGIAALVCAWQACALVLPPWFYGLLWLGFEPSLTWVSPLYHPVDWTGQAASLLVSGLVVHRLKWVTPAEVGLQGLRPQSWRVAGPVVAVVAFLLLTDAYCSRQAFPVLWWNERLYYATLPGLAEELFFRGVLLGLLNRVFVQRLPLPGTATTWGGIVGVVLFAAGHVLKLRWSRQGGQKQDVYFCCHGNQHQRAVARQTTHIRRGF